MVKLTPEACRAGRALLQWGVRELAADAGISPATVNGIEHGREPWAASAEKILASFERNGVEVTNGDRPGAFLVARRPKPKASTSTRAKKPVKRKR